MADSMTGTTGEMSPAQATIFATVPDGWANIPFIGVHEAILRALKGRGVIETRWTDGSVRQWRRFPRVELIGTTLVCWRRRDGWRSGDAS